MARKTWYVIDPEDLLPFARWIKGLSSPAAQKEKSAAQKAVSRAAKVLVTVGAMYVEAPHPDGLLPWEDEDPQELVNLVRELGYQ